MKFKNIKNSKGFTIVELLIVIIIIGILAALVLNSFRGVQERARDTERRTDINAQSTQLEVYYTDNGGYPVLTGQVNTDSWIQGAMKGADLAAWRAPNQAANSETNTATPDTFRFRTMAPRLAPQRLAPSTNFTITQRRQPQSLQKTA
jgi:prepilin-type N-terminal cleavage/methylation domain-containing protein